MTLLKLNVLIAIFGLIFSGKGNRIVYEKDLNSIELDTFIVNNYSQDAKNLYFHEIIRDSSHVDFYNPTLDTSEVIEILEILQAIYNLNSPESNRVFKHPGIHGNYCYDFNSIYLKVKTNLPEIQNLINGVIPTGNSDLDELLAKYQFDSVQIKLNYPNAILLKIYSNSEYNLIPVEKEFDNLHQVIEAYFNAGCIGGSTQIDLLRNNNSAKVTFYSGSGDCYAGCINKKYWEFKVADGKAEFIRTYGNDGTVRLKELE